MNTSTLTYTTKDAYVAAKEARELHPENPSILWRFARAAYKYAGKYQQLTCSVCVGKSNLDISDDKNCPKDQKKDILNDALTAVRKAVELDNESSDAHRW